MRPGLGVDDGRVRSGAKDDPRDVVGAALVEVPGDRVREAALGVARPGGREGGTDCPFGHVGGLGQEAYLGLGLDHAQAVEEAVDGRKVRSRQQLVEGFADLERGSSPL